MPAAKTVRSMILAVTCGTLAVTVLSLSGPAAGRDVDRRVTPPPPTPPPTYVGQVARGEETDAGTRGYHYAAANTQVLPHEVDGLRATMSVHRPGQVRAGLGQHSVGQLAVGHTRDGSYLEAGWRQYADGPRLFVYWRPADGRDTCYNFNCGFVPHGSGLQPNALLVPESEITLAFHHQGARWWLKVDGKRSGYFPDHLWNGRFKGTDFAQLYGEVYATEWQGVCPDMGNGRLARNAGAAYMRDVNWIGGPPMSLRKSPFVREVHDYGFLLTGRNSFRYGGPGEC